MKYARLLFVLSVMLFGASALFAIEPGPVTVAIPDTVMFGPEQVAFNEAMRKVPFSFDDRIVDAPTEIQPIESNVQWLKAHPDVRFYIAGYTDWNGDILYNMTLSQARADQVKKRMIALGIAPERILISAGWGKLYPVCAEQTEECWAKNRHVRLVYVPSWFVPGPPMGGM